MNRLRVYCLTHRCVNELLMWDYLVKPGTVVLRWCKKHSCFLRDSWAEVDKYLLLCSILLRYQGNMLLANQRAVSFHWKLLWAGVICLHHRCCVAHIRVIYCIWFEIERFSLTTRHNVIPSNSCALSFIFYYLCMFSHCTFLSPRSCCGFHCGSSW